VAACLQAVAKRHAMNADGINYLEIGAAYFQGNWAAAINSHFSPFYSWILGGAMRLLQPSPAWEASAVRLVSVVIFIGAFLCFEFFLRSLLGSQAREQGSAERLRWQGVVRAWGYALFLWTSLRLITIELVSPDMLVAACVYLAAGLMVRIRNQELQWRKFLGFGAILGLGCLVKAVMLPVAALMLSVTALVVRNRRQGLLKLATGGLVLVCVAAPFVVMLSVVKGRFTLGDAPRVAYALYVGDVRRKADPHEETTAQPGRRLATRLPVYAYGAIPGVTSAAAHDPPGWFRHAEVHFNLRRQVRAALRNINQFYCQQLLMGEIGMLWAVVILLTLVVAGGRAALAGLAREWIVWVPAAAALGMFALVYVAPRYVAPFVTLVCVALFSGAVAACGSRHDDLVRGLALAGALFVIVPLGVESVRDVRTIAQDLRLGHAAAQREELRVAEALGRLGIGTGDQVAMMGSYARVYWAHLARLQIVAGILLQDVERYWLASQDIQAEAIAAFREAGARAIIVGPLLNRELPPGWQRLGDTDYYALLLGYRA
jgi:hypothetical protein